MSIESKVLGQQVAYPTDYCPSILVPVPRSLNREIYDIYTPEELFRGFDTCTPTRPDSWPETAYPCAVF